MSAFFSTLPPRRRGLTQSLWFVIAFLVGLAIASVADAERQHTVRGGQNLGRIAKQYGVTVWSLAAANRMKPDGTVREGQILDVPDKGVVVVNNGQTLWSVARRHGCTIEALARANGLTPSSSIRPGMRLTLPGHTAATSGGGATERAWGPPKQRGRLDLVRVSTQRRLSVAVLDDRGRVRSQAANQLARFLRPRNSHKTRAPNRRLLSLLARVSDHFGGRTIHVVSGYRLAAGYTSHESRHVKGAAVDMRVEGVPNRVLRDYLRHFDDVGVGFYPDSRFVHFDVRERNAYWVDISGPGKKPIYLTRDEREGFDEKSRSEGLAEIGDMVEAALEEHAHGEPEDTDTNSNDE